jgi:hypothetical protein
MMEPSQNGGDREREIMKKGIGLTTVMSEDVFLRKLIVYK